jgi:DNA integrity scanning protein DisA with diadenylate cyclase activity
LKLLVAGKLIIHIKKNGYRLLSPVAKINLKLTKDLHVKFNTMKFLEENSEEMHVDIRMGKEFLDKTPKAQELKLKIGN